MRDTGSKFGTLMRAEETVGVGGKGSVMIQVNRTVVTLAKGRASRCCLFSCFSSLRRNRNRITAMDQGGNEAASSQLPEPGSLEASGLALVANDVSSINDSHPQD